jgi:hypothetical protein
MGLEFFVHVTVSGSARYDFRMLSSFGFVGINTGHDVLLFA